MYKKGVLLGNYSITLLTYYYLYNFTTNLIHKLYFKNLVIFRKITWYFEVFALHL